MEDRDTLPRVNARRKFETYFPHFGEILSERRIGPSETLYTLKDVITVYQKHDKDMDILPEEDWKKEFARILKRTIHLSGMTQGEFADRIGISQSTISKYMRRQSIPSAYVLKTMARFLKLDLDYLCNFDYLLSIYKGLCKLCRVFSFCTYFAQNRLKFAKKTRTLMREN